MRHQQPDKAFSPRRRALLTAGAATGLLSVVPAGQLWAKQRTSARILIIGAGAAGLATANRLQRSLAGARITLVPG